MTDRVPEELAAYKVESVLHEMGPWAIARVLKHNRPFVAKISPPLPLDSDSEGQQLLRKLRDNRDESIARTPVEIAGFVYDPFARRCAVIYAFSEGFVCWSQGQNDEEEAAFRLWSLCCHDQFSGHTQSLDLEDVWIDDTGYAWLDPCEPKRLVAEFLEQHQSVADPDYRQRIGSVPDTLRPLLRPDPQESARSPAERFYECARVNLEETERPYRHPGESPNGIRYAEVSDLTLIHIPWSLDEEPANRPDDPELEWFNGWFWEPCRFRIDEEYQSGHDLETGQPRSSHWFVLVIMTVSRIEVRFNNLRDLMVRSRSDASSRATIIPLDRNGRRIRKGIRIQLDGIGGSEAVVRAITPEGRMRLSFEDFWVGQESHANLRVSVGREDGENG
jgi:hypothetical protein